VTQIELGKLKGISEKHICFFISIGYKKSNYEYLCVQVSKKFETDRIRQARLKKIKDGLVYTKTS